ncbi:unnamed protein product [Hymenolepis diminuta]|uniref:Uncharacterized protein n=1 Tax=Hymenolepis diminuta TaxID=6216 RepID=A0A564YYZ2_HYMDI|nr:unnamed protein product [Hymenolepis diminuta]
MSWGRMTTIIHQDLKYKSDTFLGEVSSCGRKQLKRTVYCVETTLTEIEDRGGGGGEGGGGEGGVGGGMSLVFPPMETTPTRMTKSMEEMIGGWLCEGGLTRTQEVSSVMHTKYPHEVTVMVCGVVKGSERGTHHDPSIFFTAP